MKAAGAAILQKRIREKQGEAFFSGYDPDQDDVLSDVIFHLAEPLLPPVATLEEYRTAFSFAVIAWNLGLLPSESQAEALTTGPYSKFPPTVRNTIASLLVTRLRSFPQLHRWIEDFEVSISGNDVTVSVIASVPTVSHVHA